METITLRAKGDCMSPLIKDGETVTVQRKSKFRTGDVVLYFNERRDLAIHRYASLFGTEKTKADRSREIDPGKITKPFGKALVNESLLRRIWFFFFLKALLLREMLKRQ